MQRSVVVICLLVVLPLIVQAGNIGKVHAGDYGRYDDVNVKNDEEKEMANIPAEFMVFLKGKGEEKSLDKDMSEEDINNIADEFKIFLKGPDDDDTLKVKDDGALKVKDIGTLKVKDDDALKVKDDGALKVKYDGVLKVKDDGALKVKDDDALKVKDDGALKVKDDGALKVKYDSALNVKSEKEQDNEHKVPDEFKVFMKGQGSDDDDTSKQISEKRVMSQDEVMKFNDKKVPGEFKEFLHSLNGVAPEVKAEKRKFSEKEFINYKLNNIPDEMADIYMKLRDNDVPEMKRERRVMTEDEVYNYNQKQIQKMGKDNIPKQFAEFLKEMSVDAPKMLSQKRKLSEDEILKYNKKQFYKWHGKDIKHSPQHLELEFDKWEWHMRKFQRQQKIREAKLAKYRNKNWQRVEAALRKQRNKHSSWLKHLLDRSPQDRHKRMNDYHHRRSPDDHHRNMKNFHHVGL